MRPDSSWICPRTAGSSTIWRMPSRPIGPTEKLRKPMPCSEKHACSTPRKSERIVPMISRGQCSSVNTCLNNARKRVAGWSAAWPRSSSN